MKGNIFRMAAMSALWGAVSLLSAVSVRGQSGSTPQAVFKTTSHDFGKIRETDGPVSYTFEFTNHGIGPFLIEFISVTCGCTTPEYSREPVLPGRSGTIRVVFDPSGKSGVFNTPVIVTANNRQVQIRLTVQGEVIPRPATVEEQFPATLSADGLLGASNTLIFGYLEQGERKSRTIEILNHGSAPMRLGYRFTSETQTPRAVGRVEIRPETLAPGQRGEITFTYDLTDAPGVYGLLATAFVLTVNGEAANRPVSAYATAVDDFRRMSDAEKSNAPKAVFSSQFHHFGTVQRNRTLTREFLIKNDGRSPLIIRKVTANGPRIGYSLPKTTLAPGQSVTLEVTLRTPDRPERMSESISVVVNDPARPMREIRLGANVE